MRVYLDASSKESPIPTTLTLVYDGEEPHMNGHTNGYVNGHMPGSY